MIATFSTDCMKAAKNADRSHGIRPNGLASPKAHAGRGLLAAREFTFASITANMRSAFRSQTVGFDARQFGGLGGLIAQAGFKASAVHAQLAGFHASYAAKLVTGLGKEGGVSVA